MISTPYAYAAEALAEGRGLLAAFENPASAARCISLYLDEPLFQRATEERARVYGQAKTWPRAAECYAALLRRVAADWRRVPRRP